ncbi:hypothetical protein PFICI_03673 [Pestalotiopsis fici W106-1]|uniref:Aminoglycoside phosphotransferase domain-containing protein n=1 Tax=Pestalotiopsis fici (strain W106-1 / CGMCC3.15140) TaxID=1229662 RepID=W3XHU6_PESFW|nr:uncharacterized protein PFICI_03673 [Pestalotiopsis fici W106-1]ETS85648.1 hypothetical protein PFICI_03673 [Pestalotiopsis fici W106-1]
MTSTHFGNSPPATNAWTAPILDKLDLGMDRVMFEGALQDNTSIWRQTPSPEVDAAWDYITTEGMEAVTAPAEDVLRSGKNVSMSVKVPTSWGLGDDAYLAQIEVFHQIHCLNQLRKEVYAEYYFTSPANDLRIGHRNHCIHMILQVLMCNADTGLIFHNWVHNSDLPAPQTRAFADFNTIKKCKNFDNILDWAREKGVKNTYDLQRLVGYIWEDDLTRRELRNLSILRDYGLESVSITPVEYSEHCPFPYNNFIYMIQLSSPMVSSTFSARSTRPGTAAPLNSKTTVFRLSNPYANDLNNANRVENEVAAQYLYRQQLSASHPELASLVPTIYAREPSRYPEISDETGFGWTICEHMPGTNLDAQFVKMDLPKKLEVVKQIAGIFAAFQKIIVPEELRGHFGGLTFDDSGQVVRGQMSICPPGPWEDYTDLWVARLRWQLHNADQSPALKGWQECGLRDRIDKLLNGNGIAKWMERIDVTQTTLAHGDFTMNNILFDDRNQRVTALLYFDFSCVTHPSQDFFTGLWDIGDGMRQDDSRLRTAILTGEFDDAAEDFSPDAKIDWEVSKAWDSTLAVQGVIRPSLILGIDKLETLWALEDAICPSNLSHEFKIERTKRKFPGKLGEIIKAATDKLIATLNELEA